MEWCRALSDAIGLCAVARFAKQFDVALGITATTRNRNDMVKFKPLTPAASRTPTLVALPDSPTHGRGDGFTGGRLLCSCRLELSLHFVPTQFIREVAAPDRAGTQGVGARVLPVFRL